MRYPDLVDSFRKVLADADNRDDWTMTEAGDGEHPRWVINQRVAMHTEVNRLREAAGLESVPMSAIELADNMASGHFDYAIKFSCYCADLATGIEKVRP